MKQDITDLTREEKEEYFRKLKEVKNPLDNYNIFSEAGLREAQKPKEDPWVLGGLQLEEDNKIDMNNKEDNTSPEEFKWYYGDTTITDAIKLQALIDILSISEYQKAEEENSYGRITNDLLPTIKNENREAVIKTIFTLLNLDYKQS